MILDPTFLPGLLLLAAELIALAAVGYVVVRVALRQTDERMALAQGLVVGPALWGLIVNFVLHVVPGTCWRGPWAGASCLRSAPAWRGALAIASDRSLVWSPGSPSPFWRSCGPRWPAAS